MQCESDASERLQPSTCVVYATRTRPMVDATTRDHLLKTKYNKIASQHALRGGEVSAPGGGGVCSGGGSASRGGVCSWGVSPSRGVSAPGGVCSWGVSASRGVSAPGGCLLPAGCVCLQGGCLLRGVSAPGGCLLPRGGGIPACTEADTPL